MPNRFPARKKEGHVGEDAAGYSYCIKDGEFVLNGIKEPENLPQVSLDKDGFLNKKEISSKLFLPEYICYSPYFCYNFMPLFLNESVSFAEAISNLNELPILVLGHRRPDGDCIGSQVALTRILLSLGKDARAVNEDPIPRTLQKFVGDTPFYSPDQVGEGEYQSYYG